jgi:hypothetical protein
VTWRSPIEVRRIVLDDDVVELLFRALDRHGALELSSDELDRLIGERLRDRDELAEAHHRLDDLGRGDAELLRILLDGDAARDGDRSRGTDDRLLLAHLAIATTAATALRALARAARGLRVDDHAALLALRHAALRSCPSGRRASGGRRRCETTTARRRSRRARVAGRALARCSSGGGLFLLLRRLDGLGLDGVGVRGRRIDRLGLRSALGRRGLLRCGGRLLLRRWLLRLGTGQRTRSSDLVDHVPLNRHTRLEEDAGNLIGIEPALARDFNDSSFSHQPRILSAMRISAPRQRRNHKRGKAFRDLNRGAKASRQSTRAHGGIHAVR